MKIHENLATMRKRKNLSQSFTADALEISRVAYGKIERGESKVTFDRLLDLCKIFECTINELINVSAIEPIEAKHIASNQNLQSDQHNLIVMSKLQHEHDKVLNYLYEIHKESIIPEVLSDVRSNIETFIEHSHHSVTSGFVEDFFAFLQQIKDAEDYAKEL